jgi:TatD DNase family protein
VLELVNQYHKSLMMRFLLFHRIHPWYIVADRVEADLGIIESKLQEKNCLALGECGLDKRIEISMELQQTVLKSIATSTEIQ